MELNLSPLGKVELVAGTMGENRPRKLLPPVSLMSDVTSLRDAVYSRTVAWPHALDALDNWG
jgi:hypothetical protein